MKKILFLILAVLVVAGCGAEKKDEKPAEVVIAEPEPVEEPAEEKPLKEYAMDIAIEKVPESIILVREGTITFHNTEENKNSNLLILRQKEGAPQLEDVIAKSNNIAPDSYWQYQFNETGEFVVEDIYSGIKAEVTVR